MEDLREVEVDQGECKTILEEGIIKTGGVGPCIAVVVYGTAFYETEEDDDDEEEEEKKLIEKRFISLYHLQDEFYQLHCLLLKELPTIEELNKIYIKYIPMLINCNQGMWVYGFDSNERPKLTQVVNDAAYETLKFAEPPQNPQANLIDEDIYIALGKQKAHCEYFGRTNNGPVEEEANFNYCVKMTKRQLVETLFSSIDNCDDAGDELELKKVKLTQVELIGGQRADEEIPGSEMRARALETNFRNPHWLAALSQDVADDLEIDTDFSDIAISTDQLLPANKESYFNVNAYFNHTGMKVKLELVSPDEEMIPGTAQIPITNTSVFSKEDKSKKRKLDEVGSKNENFEEEAKKLKSKNT